VSVLHLAQDEKSVLSGSWDKTIKDWDLDKGEVRRTFAGSGGQISAIEPRPLSTLPIPEDNGLSTLTNGTFSSNNASKPKPNGFLANGALDQASQADNGTQDAAGSPDDDMNSLFGDDDEAPSMPLADDDDDEFSRAIATGLQQQNDEDADADVDMADSGGPVLPPSEDVKAEVDSAAPVTEQTQTTVNGAASDDTLLHENGLPHSEEPTTNGVSQPEKPPTSDSTFLDASMDGTIRIWDRRQSNPIARITPPRGVSPWCMSATWSPDGNFIYAGRKNNAIDEYSLHKGLREPTRTFRFPGGSGPVSAVRAMPNGKHLIWYVSINRSHTGFMLLTMASSASYDILRLYDLEMAQPTARHSVVPFLIVPGHRTGVISQLYMDPTCTFLISSAGNRGWEGYSTEVLLGYEIGCLT
jgi:transcriptional activator SPT8